MTFTNSSILEFSCQDNFSQLLEVLNFTKVHAIKVTKAGQLQVLIEVVHGCSGGTNSNIK